MTTKSEGNQAVEQPKYILVNVGWKDNLLFNIPDGMRYLELQATAIRIEGDMESRSKEPLKISSNAKPVTITYMTEERFKQIRLDALMDPKEED